MFDWSVLNFVAAIGVALSASAVTFGAIRQQVGELEKRMDAQDSRIGKLAEAVAAAAQISAQVSQLRTETLGGHALLLEKQEGGQKLVQTQLEGVRGEMRTFMEGLAAAGLGKRSALQPVPLRKT